MATLPTNWAQFALGSPARGLVPYATGMEPQRPVTPQMPPNLGRYMQLATLTNGNNSLEDEESLRRQYLLQIQQQAQRENALRSGREAVEAGKIMQAQQAADQQKLNGVVNGVAFRNGQPVGFAGNVQGATNLTYPTSGDPILGQFTHRQGGLMGRFADDASQQAFNKQLWTHVGNIGREQQGPRNDIAGPPRPTTANVAAAPTSFDSIPTPAGVPAEFRAAMLPYITGPLSPVRQAIEAQAAPQQRPAIPNRGDLSVAEVRDQEANITRGLAARDQLKTFQAKLPELLGLLSEEEGLVIDEDVLASDILKTAGPLKEKPSSFDKSIPVSRTRAGQIAERLGLDPKVVVRWAQDRKKAKA